MKKVFFPSTENITLCGVWHFPQKKSTKAIILAHGITVDKNEDENIFVELADTLTDNGFAVFRFDFRGSGESDGKSVDMTIKGELDDLRAAYLQVHAAGFTSISLLGASFGGGVSVIFSSENTSHLASLCLWNPVLNYNHCFLHPTLPWLLQKINTMKNDFAEKGWTELGSRKFKIGKQLFMEMETLHPYQLIQEINIPLCIIHGTKDTYVPYEDSKKYCKNESNLITIDGAGHGFTNNTAERESAIKATVTFFQKTLK